MALLIHPSTQQSSAKQGSPAQFCHCTPPNYSLWQQRTAEVQRGEMLKNCVLPKYLSTLKVLQNPAKSVLLCIHAVIYPGPKNISYFDADLKKKYNLVRS